MDLWIWLIILVGGMGIFIASLHLFDRIRGQNPEQARLEALPRWRLEREYRSTLKKISRAGSRRERQKLEAKIFRLVMIRLNRDLEEMSDSPVEV